jgi:hypothetical protein
LSAGDDCDNWSSAALLISIEGVCRSFGVLSSLQ